MSAPDRSEYADEAQALLDAYMDAETVITVVTEMRSGKRDWRGRFLLRQAWGQRAAGIESGRRSSEPTDCVRVTRRERKEWW